MIETADFAFEVNVTLVLENTFQDYWGPKQGYIGPLSNRVNVRMYFYCLTIDINNFAFEAKVILGLESTLLGGCWVVWCVVGWLAFVKL